MKRAAARPRGFTLIELMIVIAVVAVAAAAAAPAVSSLTGANARAAAGELSGAMRWLFDTAALRHTTCRLALDLDNATWWPECAPPRGRAAAAGAPAPYSPEEDEALAERFPDESSPEARRLLAKSRFGEFADRLVKRRELPGNTGFTEVWAQHLSEPAAKGVAYVYFYPQGQSETARVTVADAGHVYSIVLQPLTGRARVVPGKPEVPR
jgi:general secretion pathway protein H